MFTMKRKRISALLLTILLIAAIAAPVYAEGRVLHISSVEGLKSLVAKCRLDTYSKGITVVLDTDLDLKNEPFEPFAAFCGTFIGNDHTISGFVPSTDGAHQGFFRFVLEGGVVRNLHVQGKVTPETVKTQIGGLVGTNYGTVAACSFTGEVRGLEMVGGVVGENLGTVLDCKAHGEVVGKRFTGGVVGSSEGSVVRCENDASVNITIETDTLDISEIDVTDLTSMPLVAAKDTETVSDTGGIVGLSTGIISDCVNRGTVGYQHYGYNVGGVVGRQSGLVRDCENYGYVCGRKDVAGIAGQMEPFVLLTTTENLLNELQLMSDAIDIAMTHMDTNAGGTKAVMDELSYNASSAESNALDMNANSKNPIMIVEEPESPEEEEASRQAFKDKISNFFTASGDNLTLIMDTLGEDTLGRLMSGDIDSITDADWTKLTNLGTDQISTGGAYSSIIDDIRARREERDAEKAAKDEKYNSVPVMAPTALAT